MVIPESQLDTWSRHVKSGISRATADSIRNALDSSSSRVKDRKVEVFLQGSYRNHTNLYGDSDVDVVAQMNETFGRDISRLSPPEQDQYYRAYPSSSYTWEQFRNDVLATFESYYGQSHVDSAGNKALTVLGDGSNRLDADVLVAMQYRKYRSFSSPVHQDYIEGVRFFSMREGIEIINYPKEHYQAGVEKQEATSANYKRTVRMFKSARNCLHLHGAIEDGVAPSYFIEGLFSNVPNNLFQDALQRTYFDTIDWLCDADWTKMTCQNKQELLFGTRSSAVQWNGRDATDLLRALVDLYARW